MPEESLGVLVYDCLPTLQVRLETHVSVSEALSTETPALRWCSASQVLFQESLNSPREWIWNSANPAVRELQDEWLSAQNPFACSGPVLTAHLCQFLWEWLLHCCNKGPSAMHGQSKQAGCWAVPCPTRVLWSRGLSYSGQIFPTVSKSHGHSQGQKAAQDNHICFRNLPLLLESLHLWYEDQTLPLLAVKKRLILDARTWYLRKYVHHGVLELCGFKSIGIKMVFCVWRPQGSLEMKNKIITSGVL